MKRRYPDLIIIAAFSVFMVATAFSSVEADAASEPTAGMKNSVLLKAMSTFEDLTEYALSNNQEGMVSALHAYESQAAEVSQTLSPRALEELNRRVYDLKKAMDSGDNQAAALMSVEAYRVLIQSLEASALVVPVQTQMLDYAGFKLMALTHAKPPDWAAAETVVEEAQGQWNSLRPRVTDGALRDAFDTAIGGMKRAVTSKDQEMAVFAAQVVLAQVDLLEGYFERSAR